MQPDEQIAVSETLEGLRVVFPPSLGRTFLAAHSPARRIGRLISALLVAAMAAGPAYLCWRMLQVGFGHVLNAPPNWQTAVFMALVMAAVVLLMLTASLALLSEAVRKLFPRRAMLHATRRHLAVTQRYGPFHRHRVRRWQTIARIEIVGYDATPTTPLRWRPAGCALVARGAYGAPMLLAADIGHGAALDAAEALRGWWSRTLERPAPPLVDATAFEQLNRACPEPPPGCAAVVLPDGTVQLRLAPLYPSLGAYLRRRSKALGLLAVFALWAVAALVFSRLVGIAAPGAKLGGDAAVGAVLLAILIPAMYREHLRPKSIMLDDRVLKGQRAATVARETITGIRVGTRRGQGLVRYVLYAVCEGRITRALCDGELPALQWCATELRQRLGVPVVADKEGVPDVLDPRLAATDATEPPAHAVFILEATPEGVQLSRGGDLSGLGCGVVMGAGSLLLGLVCTIVALVAKDPATRRGSWGIALCSGGFALLLLVAFTLDSTKGTQITIGQDELVLMNKNIVRQRTQRWRWEELDAVGIAAELGAVKTDTRIVVTPKGAEQMELVEVPRADEAQFILTLLRRQWHEARVIQTETSAD